MVDIEIHKKEIFRLFATQGYKSAKKFILKQLGRIETRKLGVSGITQKVSEILTDVFSDEKLMHDLIITDPEIKGRILYDGKLIAVNVDDNNPTKTKNQFALVVRINFVG